MSNKRKTKAQLLAENQALQHRMIDLHAVMTSLKRAEETLQRSEERYRSLTMATAQIVWTADPQGQAIDDMPLWRAFTGQGPEEIKGVGWFNALHAEDRQQTLDRWRQSVATHTVYTTVFRVRHCDGEYRYLGMRWVPVLEQNDQVREWVSACSDITERKRAEEALHESEGRYRSLFENAYDGIACLTVDGIFTCVNRELTTILGWSREELLGRHYREFVTPAYQARTEERIRRIRAGETAPTIYVVEALHKEGHVVLLEGRTRLIRDAKGQSIGVLGIYRDITARTRAEEELQHAKEAAEAADRAKSEFLATMSHELRTPLGIILGYTEILLDETIGLLTAEQANRLQRIDRSARELLDLITTVLDLSRLEADRMPLKLGTTRVTDLFHEVQTETQRLQEQSRLTFVWAVEPALPLLYTDPGKLKIVLKNLIGNAVKFTPSGRITVAARPSGEGVELSVSDTGSGIPPEAHALIFEPFWQLQHSTASRAVGSGLGLHIVKRLLGVLGGTIRVESEVGQGSTFRVWLPSKSPAFPEASSETVH